MKFIALKLKRNMIVNQEGNYFQIPQQLVNKNSRNENERKETFFPFKTPINQRIPPPQSIVSKPQQSSTAYSSPIISNWSNSETLIKK